MARLTFADWRSPIRCGGTAVFPDDALVADHDGAVVIPRAMVQTLIDNGQDGEVLEEFILDQVNAGKRLPGRYPPGGPTRAEFEAWKEGTPPRETARSRASSGRAASFAGHTHAAVQGRRTPALERRRPDPVRMGAIRRRGAA